MSPDRGWKKAERQIAKDLGGKRLACTGERHGADVSHPLFKVQLKVRRALPAWIFDWLGGIVANARPSGSIGVLVLNKPRCPRRQALVILRWDDWVSIVGTPQVPDEEGSVDGETIEARED